MSETTKLADETKRVTKSIRLTKEESEEMACLVSGTPYAEAALMGKWVLEGMQRFRIDQAIEAYQKGYANLRQAAEQARLPVAVLLEEMAAVKVAVLDEAKTFGPGLETLRKTFNEVR